MESCEKYCELIDAYIDGGISAGGRALLLAHLQGCPDCASLLRMTQLLRETELSVPPPAGLKAAVMEKVTAERTPKKALLFPFSRPFALAAACLALVLLAVGGALRLPFFAGGGSASPGMGRLDGGTESGALYAVMDESSDKAAEDAAADTDTAGAQDPQKEIIQADRESGARPAEPGGGADTKPEQPAAGTSRNEPAGQNGTEQPPPSSSNVWDEPGALLPEPEEESPVFGFTYLEGNAQALPVMGSFRLVVQFTIDQGGYDELLGNFPFEEQGGLHFLICNDTMLAGLMAELARREVAAEAYTAGPQVEPGARDVAVIVNLIP